MTTTIMRDSIVGDKWILDTLAACPIQAVTDPETGQPTGDFITGPVRLTFFDAFTLPPPSKDNENPKFGGSLLLTPQHDITLLNNEVYRVAGENFADKYDATSGQYYGIRMPFRNQAEKQKFQGYTPGAYFFSASSQFKPPIVDIRGNPIVDPSKVYPGVWAICTVNVYHYANPKNPGVGFGLQSAMIIGDDTSLGGGGADPKKQFAQIQGAITAPTVSAAQAGAAMPPVGAPPSLAPTHAPPAHGMPPAYAPPAAAATPAPPPGLPGAPVTPAQSPAELAEMRAMGLIP